MTNLSRRAAARHRTRLWQLYRSDSAARRLYGIGARLRLAVPVRPMQWTGWLVTLLVIGISLPPTFAEFHVPMPDAEDDTL